MANGKPGQRHHLLRQIGADTVVGVIDIVVVIENAVIVDVAGVVRFVIVRGTTEISQRFRVAGYYRLNIILG